MQADKKKASINHQKGYLMNDQSQVQELSILYLFLGGEWQHAKHNDYHANIQYSVKLACGKEFTGPTCSFAKLCLNPKVKKHPRLVCTKEGEIVCRPGWDGVMCEKPICAPHCDTDHGFCERPGECKCKVGYHGKNCDQCDKLLGCSRNGYCEKAFECKCREGWKGVDAQFVNPRPRIVFSSPFIDP